MGYCYALGDDNLLLGKNAQRVSHHWRGHQLSAPHSTADRAQCATATIIALGALCATIVVVRDQCIYFRWRWRKISMRKANAPRVSAPKTGTGTIYFRRTQRYPRQILATRLPQSTFDVKKRNSLRVKLGRSRSELSTLRFIITLSPSRIDATAPDVIDAELYYHTIECSATNHITKLAPRLWTPPQRL